MLRARLALHDQALAGQDSLARPDRFLTKEPFGALLTGREQVFDEGARAVQLRRIVELLCFELDDSNLNRLVVLPERRVSRQELVDLLNEVELLGERQIPSQLVSTI